jgi:hypothetical protein
VETWVGITGSRGYAHPEVVRNFVQRCLPETGIVSGACKNAPDRWAVDTAKAMKRPYKEIPADWERYRKAAGFRRNIEIVLAATHVVGFWDGKSRGTRHTIALAFAAERLFRVYGPDGRPIELDKVRSMIPTYVLRDAALEWAARVKKCQETQPSAV